MKAKLVFPILLGFLFIVMVALVSAVDDQGNDNNPFTNENANACYNDGEMAFKCDTEWEWYCGWYMIRYDAGIYSKDEVPETCQILIPADVTPEAEILPQVTPEVTKMPL